jgi:hypothetical protein
VCECCVLSGRGPCDGLITRRSPTDCGASQSDREASTMIRPWPTGGCCAIKTVCITVYVQGC